MSYFSKGILAINHCLQYQIRKANEWFYGHLSTGFHGEDSNLSTDSSRNDLIVKGL